MGAVGLCRKVQLKKLAKSKGGNSESLKENLARKRKDAIIDGGNVGEKKQRSVLSKKTNVEILAEIV